MQSMLDELYEEIEILKEENKILRRFLWLNHGCETHCLYGDDGEMQCGKCLIDFKRGDVNLIIKSISDRNMRAFFCKTSEQPK